MTALRSHGRVGELQDMLVTLCSEPNDTAFFVFVDAVDECDILEGRDDNARSLALLLRELTDTAYAAGFNLNICISHRRYLVLDIKNCAEIKIDAADRGDIGRYIGRELDSWTIDSASRTAIETSLIARAGGIFLWARLALELIKENFDAGLRLDVTFISRGVPDQLDGIFDKILDKLSSEEKLQALRLFQWVLFAQRPLSAEEWFHVLALIHTPDLRSVRTWRLSLHGLESIDQFSRRVRGMTGGLLEVTGFPLQESVQDLAELDIGSDHVASEGSVSVGAGSMEHLDAHTPLLKVIHESVREYFLSGNGFNMLGGISPAKGVGDGHMYIMTTCLRYTMLDEVKYMATSDPPSVTSNTAAFMWMTKVADGKAPTVRSEYSSIKYHHDSRSNISVTSFGASAATSVHRSSCPGAIEIIESREDFAEPPRNQIGQAELHNERIARLQEWLADNVSPDMPDSIVCDAVDVEPHVLDSEDGVVEQQDAGYEANEDPVLRLYTIDMFTHHAVAAQSGGADPSELLEQIERERKSKSPDNCWYKWCCLNESIRSDTTPPYFAAEWNLLSWVEWYASHSPFVLNQVGGELRFPLLAALNRGHDSIVTCISSHVDADRTNKWGQTVLHLLAARRGGEKILEQICDAPENGWARHALYSRKSHKDHTAYDAIRRRAIRDLSKLVSSTMLHTRSCSNCYLEAFQEVIHRLTATHGLKLPVSAMQGRGATAFLRSEIASRAIENGIAPVISNVLPKESPYSRSTFCDTIEECSPAIRFLTRNDRSIQARMKVCVPLLEDTFLLWRTKDA